jgi:GMP synthase (glutamine-hydrolysing)
MDTLVILDFGSQYSQLIARRIRELEVFSELLPYDAPSEEVMQLQPKGFILSGGPASVYQAGAPQIPAYILKSGLPILGICYGMQALVHSLGGKVSPSNTREYGSADIEVTKDSKLISRGTQTVWMSHGDRIERVPPGFDMLAHSENSPIAVMGDESTGRYGLQFHPEVQHTPLGMQLLRAFVERICEAEPGWNPATIIDTSITSIREQVGQGRILAAVSGGLDSSVAVSLVHRAVGDQLTSIFVNSGLLRADEPETVAESLKINLGLNLVAVDATEDFLQALQGVTDPEQKRLIIGEKYIRVFERHARGQGDAEFLAQGTIYPDVIESRAPERELAARIKSHHNVAGLPEDMQFQLVEPLRYLFKDEVRKVGEALGLPGSLLWRQPFPGPGLAIRCIGEVTYERLERLRAVDRILQQELADVKTSQAFAVLLPVRSVGVMGDRRTYMETVAIRAVTTDDFMTADWTRIPHETLASLSNRIVNEVAEVNRVVYDITSKPPATIEWE